MAEQPLRVEVNGINVIRGAERKGRPRDMFWPWFAATVSVAPMSLGAFVLAFGVSFWQALVVSVIGAAASCVLCGFIAVAGRRGSASTMVVSRAAFGVRGNKLPALISWLFNVGWEIVLATIGTLAITAVLGQLGRGGGTLTKVITLVVVVALTIFTGVMGFDLIMRMQAAITLVSAVLTVAFIVLAAHRIHWAAVSGLHAGSAQAAIGALIFIMTIFGLSWVNNAADYSRYLPRKSSGAGIIGWTTLAISLAPTVLLVFGLLLAGSSATLSRAIGANPVGALAVLLPEWFLVPFVIGLVVSLIGTLVINLYSSGLALLALGVRVPRYAAALIDGALMIGGSAYLLFVAGNFLPQFEGFLITLSVPIAAWCGVLLADIAMRHADYAEPELFDPAGRYGDVRWLPVSLVLLATATGWGLVTNASVGWLSWQGYLLGPLGLGGEAGAWAHANLGVVVALALGFLPALLTGWPTVRAQEAPLLSTAAAASAA